MNKDNIYQILESDMIKMTKEEIKDKILKMPIEALDDVSTDTIECMKKIGIDTIEKILNAF